MEIQLLCTFVKSYKLNKIVDEITNCYKLAFKKIYVLENVENDKELICSYNIDTSFSIDNSLIPDNTISVHRKKETNSIYTINALNHVISLLNDGMVDNTFPVPWENYKNQILVINADGLKRIYTKINKVIHL